MQSITPLPLETEESLVEGEGGTRNEPVSNEIEPSKPEQGNVKWTPPVDLSHLSCDQQEVVREMLREESGDIGCIEDLKLEIKLVDNNAVKKTCNSIPNPLYDEVKPHLHDMITRGRTSNSKSPCSSPVVCVYEKDAFLDYVLIIDLWTAKTRMNLILSHSWSFKTS